MRVLIALPIILSLFTSVVMAEEAQPDIPPPPPMPEVDVYGQIEEGVEPQITIRKRGHEQIEEYSINGQVYMVKITPSKGLPYYLMDSDGDGSLETRRNSLDDPEVVKWRLFTW